jgi:hypothetical protein
MASDTPVRPNLMLESGPAWVKSKTTKATLKNKWDKHCFKKFHPELMANQPVIWAFNGENNVDFFLKDDGAPLVVYGTLEFYYGSGDSKKVVVKRAMLEGKHIFILPAPPHVSYDPEAYYETANGIRIPSKLWEIAFFLLKPFVVEELCNEVKKGCVCYAPLFEELILIQWAVLEGYTLKHAPNITIPEEKRLLFSYVYQKALDHMIGVVHGKNGDFNLIQDKDMEGILYRFCEAFYIVFLHDNQKHV